jgi:hypothetical protein
MIQLNAHNNCISFDARKTKSMVVTSIDVAFSPIASTRASFTKTINQSLSHLGHLITSSLCDDENIVKRRGEFLGQVNI